jgi:thiol-disulfide isomerase/thioredoxin
MDIRRAALVLVLPALLAAACARTEPVSGTTPDPEAILSASPTDLPEGDVATYFAVLERARGAPLVVNVWASWCGPCRAEAPDLARVASAYAGRVRFLGIDVLDARPSAQAFVREAGWPYPSLYDPDGAIRDRLGLVGQPVTLLYDAGGTLVGTHVGPITAEQLAAELDRLLAA